MARASAVFPCTSSREASRICSLPAPPPRWAPSVGRAGSVAASAQAADRTYRMRDRPDMMHSSLRVACKLSTFRVRHQLRKLPERRMPDPTDHLRDLAKTATAAAEQLGPEIARAAELVRATVRRGGTLFFCGNG